MIDIRRTHERGSASLDWLDSKHTFSFGHYHDPRHMGFGTLRVINEDWVQPGGGFDTHGHKDMEIVTYVLDGALEHKDSLGTGSVIRPGDVQRMTAGSGIRHSEFNHSNAETVHLLQIWILPEENGLAPGYEQKNFPGEEKRGQLRLIASRDGRDGSVTIHQDTDLYAALLGNGESATHTLAGNRKAWIQAARGSLTLNGTQLAQGDGAAISDIDEVVIESTADDTEALLFDMK
ncbi:MAG: pirin family protein [Rhodospirillales bacterium]